MNSNYRGLAFLLSLGSLPLACSKEGGETETGTESTGPGTNTDPSGTGTTAADGTDSAPTTSTTDTTAADPTDGTDGTGTNDTDTGSTEDTVCVTYGMHSVECYPRYASYLQKAIDYCENTKFAATKDGPACLEALDAVFVCLSNIDCAEIENPDNCTPERDAVTTACPSIDESSDSTDGETDSSATG